MNKVVDRVTSRIQERSEKTRGAYLARIHAAANDGPTRGSLSCSNLAHGIAVWADLCELELLPVVEDAEAASGLSKIYGTIE